MAETVKKSRIVSDDNMEESLMEEFNMRLKSCLSQDPLETDPESPLQEENVYENIDTVRTSSAIITKSFIQTERTEEILNSSNSSNISNGHAEITKTENIYENVKTINKTSTEYMDMESGNLEKKEKPTTEAIYEDLKTEDQPTPNGAPEDATCERTKPSFTLLTAVSVDAQEKADLKSAKDRMLLSTDDTSTLFFTQTVTSPMLTPSEENVDFLKGFRRESSTNSSPKDSSRSEESPAVNQSEIAVESGDAEVEILEEENGIDDQPAEKYVDQVQENIYENLETMDEAVYENVEDLKSKRSDTDCFNKSETLSEPCSEEVQEVVSQIEQRKTSDFEDDDMTEISDVYSLDKQISDSDSSNLVLEPARPEDLACPRNNDRFGVIQDYINSERVAADCDYQEELEVMEVSKTDIEAEEEPVSEEPQKVGYDDAEVIEYIAMTEEPKRRVPSLEKAEDRPDQSGDFHNEAPEEDFEDETDDGFHEVRSPAHTRIVDEIVKSYVSTKTDLNVTNREKDTETVPAKIVQNLTSQFMKGGEDDTPSKNKKHDVNQLKSVDIMKQINKFEQKDDVVEKSSFSKFDALQKKNVLHIRSSDSTKAQEKFNGTGIDTTLCKCCGKQVFQMEQMKAEKAVWHKNCFRCQECNKQLNVDTYESHEGTLYCKPHFKALFAPKAVGDTDEPPSDKPDLGLEELQSLNVKERFQVFEQQQYNDSTLERTQVNVKRSPSILSKLAKFQSKGMDIGVTDESLNGIPIEESSSEEEEEDIPEGEDAELVRAKRVQKEKPFHFTGMSDVKNRFEHGDSNSRDERREERKQEIQSIRNKLFMGKQGKMKEAYQEAVMKSESSVNLKKEDIQVCDTKTIKERFEKGEVVHEALRDGKDEEEQEVYESEISKNSRSLFLQLDANASKVPQLTTVTPKLEVRKSREGSTPERELYHDPDIIRADEGVEDSVIAKESHTATKMLNKFRQMEENMSREPAPQGPKPLKRFTPPPEPSREDRSSEDEATESEEEEDEADQISSQKLEDEDLIEAKKAARAKQLKAKFEKWEAKEIKKEQNSSLDINEEEQSQIESTKLIRERFESMRESHTEVTKQPKIKVNRFV